MTVQRIVLSNAVHHTRAVVVARLPPGERPRINRRQAEHAWQRLCGVRACTCGDVTGSSPPRAAEVGANIIEL